VRLGEPLFLRALFRRGLDAHPHEIIHNRREGNQPEEAPIPPPVEDIAREQEQHVLRPEAALHNEPIQPEDDRQEEQEFRGVEEHGLPAI